MKTWNIRFFLVSFILKYKTKHFVCLSVSHKCSVLKIIHIEFLKAIEIIRLLKYLSVIFFYFSYRLKWCNFANIDLTVIFRRWINKKNIIFKKFKLCFTKNIIHFCVVLFLLIFLLLEFRLSLSKKGPCVKSAIT